MLHELPLLRGVGKHGVPPSQPAWLNGDIYIRKIQPQVAGITVSAIATKIGVSMPYATDIRAGRRRPHPRHLEALAKLVGVEQDTVRT